MKKLHGFTLTLFIILCLGGLEVANVDATEESAYNIELRNGNLDKAHDLFWEAIRKVEDPSGKPTQLSVAIQGITFMSLFSTVSETQQYDFGITTCNEAIEYWPQSMHPFVLLFRSGFWEQKGEYAKVMEDYSTILELEPDNETALASSAWYLATFPEVEFRDGKKAVEYAQKAIEVAEEEKASSFNALAAAYAEQGNFQEAITTQEKAISLLKENDKEIREQYERHLASYKERKPWRMESPKAEGK